MTSANSTSAVDVVTTEVIRNFFQSCAEDMNAVLIRSAYSPIIYEVRDCSVVLLDANGDMLGMNNGLPIFLGNLEFCVKYAIDALGKDSFRKGDAYVLNDCYIGGGHLNDVTVFTPIFWNDQLVGFGATRAHWMDIGAKDPGVSMDTRDIHQEGFRIGPTKVIEGYRLRADWLDMFKRNSRFPHMLVGDFNAQVAACRTGEERFAAALDRFGADTLWAARDAIFRQTAELERTAIRNLPDGVYTAEGMLDSDGAGTGPIPLRVKLIISGEDVTLDFDGAPPMVAGSINGSKTSTICAARYAYKCLVLPERGVDGGSFSTLTIKIPPGSILSAEEPAACQYYYSPLGLLHDLTITALAKALPDAAAAAHHGDSMNVAFAGVDPRSGSPYVSIDATAGGWGGFEGCDGADALLGSSLGAIKIHCTEIFEANYPIRVREYALRPESEGPGRFRGGFGVRRTYEFDADTSVFLWFERSVTPAWGLFDGEGAIGPVVDISGSRECHELKVNRLPVKAGDVMTLYTGGGGGWGDPFERDPIAVLEDVRDGLISPRRAAERYGVVLAAAGTAIDAAATEKRRVTRRRR